MKRREFLRGGVFGIGLLATSNARSASPQSPDLFTLGVASGDPTPDGVVLWTRLAPDPLNGGGMPPVPALVRWRVATDWRMRHVVQHGLAVAWPALGHAVHVEVRGLDSDRWYYYQFSVGGEESPIGRTRTLRSRFAAAGQFRFAFVSCQNWQHGLYTAYHNLAQEDLDLVVHLGDYIYEGAANPQALRQHDGPEVESLESYRNRFALYKTDPHLQRAHAAFPWLVVPDDHEVQNNYAAALSSGDVDPLRFLARRANAYRAYYEHMPLRPASVPVGPSMGIYRGLRVGRLVEFSALDTRQYRSDQPCGDRLRPRCAGALDPAQTMTGSGQERWLLDRLGGSAARWNVIAQQTMFAQFDFLAGQNQLFNMDQWDGYVAARQRITNFLQQRSPSNPIVITGDIHSSWVHDLKVDYDNPSSQTVGTEFVGSSISSDFPSIALPFVTAALPENTHTRFFDGRFRGYVRCAVSLDAWVADFRAVPTILDDQASAFTLASFLVLNGQPGAIQIG